jgi:hypothetical protein
LVPVRPCLKRTRPHSAPVGSQHAHADLLYDFPDAVSDLLIGHGEQLCAENNDPTKPLAYFGLVMPDEAPGLLGFVGPVEVPPDPPALLLPNPAFALMPDVAPGVAVGDPTGPLLGAGTGPLAPCCANAAPLAPTSNNAKK